uniref:myosin light chain 5 isoform X1 n=1 Tax=Ictidomys tridecemlineatus TaxID=43179 RepID=UPI001A9DE6BA|nr:myosin light chain 5 isoform X1 [Ictidomys tridecemlineatus]
MLSPWTQFFQHSPRPPRGTKPLHQNSPWGIPQARPEASGPAPGAGEGGQVSSYGRVPSQPPLCLNIEKTPPLSPNPASPLTTSDLRFPPQQLCPRLRVWGEFTCPSLYPIHLPESTLPKSPALFWGHPGEQQEWAASVNKGRGAGGDVPALVNPASGFATGKTNVKDDELDAMLREASGPINFTMFLNLFGEKLTSTDTEETILNAFKMLDPDGKGSIHKEYIKRLLMSQADKMTATEVGLQPQRATEGQQPPGCRSMVGRTKNSPWCRGSWESGVALG